jgi:hypothetical protein
MGVLDDSALTVRSGRDDNNVFIVINGDDDSGGQFDLLPGLLHIQNVHTFVGLVVDVTFHLMVDVLCANVATACNQS